MRNAFSVEGSTGLTTQGISPRGTTLGYDDLRRWRKERAVVVDPVELKAAGLGVFYAVGVKTLPGLVGWNRTMQLASQPFVEALQVAGDEPPVLANQLTVEVDLAAAVVLALDEDQVPVDAAAVAVVGDVVGVAGG